MTTYPILVRDFPSSRAALTIVCERCHAEEVIRPDDILNEGLYTCPRQEYGAYGKPVLCAGPAVMKYEPADECRACKKLGFFAGELKGCCSRVCMLQAEYVATLRGVA